MKLLIQGILGWVLFVFTASPVYAESDMAAKAARNCETELKTFCADVTPGQGRILACLYAYSDKSSKQCRDTIADAYDDLKLISAVSSHLQNECGEDLEKYCNKVSPGQGRIMNCLEDHDAELSRKCKAALKEVGFRD